MPYIGTGRRKELEEPLEQLKGQLNSLDNSVGDLNYTITKLILNHVETKGKRYEHCNAVLGVLDAVSKEFYRKYVSDYEDEKIKQNGDVY